MWGPVRDPPGIVSDGLERDSLPLRSDLEATPAYLRRLSAVFEERLVRVVEVREHDSIAGIDPTL